MIEAGTTVTVDGEGTLTEWNLADSLQINGALRIINGGSVVKPGLPLMPNTTLDTL